MKKVICLLTFILIAWNSCAVKTESNFENFVCPSNCHCNITNPYVNRHQMICPSENPKAVIELFETFTDHDYSVDAVCYSQDQYVYDILSLFKMDSAKQAHFYNCSLPEGDTFGSATGMIRLRRLTFRGGNVTSFPNEYFGELVDLEELDLSGNRLSALPNGFVNKLTKLNKFYLNHNRFKSLADVMTEKPANLRRLEVTHNQIEDITKRDLEIFNRNIVVDVGHNLIQYVSAASFAVPQRYKEDIGFFDLDNNPFDCSCRARDFIAVIKIWADYVPFFSLSLKCATPERNAGRYVWQFTKESICEEV